MRQRWGLRTKQELTPALEDKLAFTITATGSFSEAAALAEKWLGSSVDDSTLHVLTQRLGERAEEQLQARLKTVPQESAPQRIASELAIFELDGWQARYRGPGFGKKKTKKKRVEWHEVKVGVFYLQEQAGGKSKDRGVLSEKVVVSWVEEGGAELGRRLHWEAVRRGAGRAQHILVLGDGAPWIWNVAADRWMGATELLDFYHASEHVWALGRALYGEDQAKEWVEEGRIGELVSVQTAFSYFNRDATNILNRKEVGGGALYDVGCYAVNTSRYLYGREPARAIALVERDPEFGTDRLTSGMLDYGGAHLTFTCGTQVVPYQRVNAFGTKGRIEIEIPFNAPAGAPCKIFLDDGSTLNCSSAETTIFPIVDQYSLQAEAFSRAVRTGGSVENSIEVAVGNMRVIDALFRSAESGRWETV